MAKKMIVNCGTCDARNVMEETLQSYETVAVNAGTVLVTPESKVLLDRYGVALNCGSVVELPLDAKLSTVNGSAQIKATDSPAEKTYLMVNGSLEIGPGTREVLQQYVGITVNGRVLHPESLSGCLTQLKVNGSIEAYPDDAIVLKRNAVIDRVFALRAKSKLYWSARRLIMVDSALDAAKLAERGARFSSKEAIVAESLVESLIDLIDESVEIIIVPDGTAVITDDLELDDLTVKKYGNKLYITGDVTVAPEAEAAIAGLEYLNIHGDISVPAARKEALLQRLTQHGGELKVIKGTLLRGKISARITKAMLEGAGDGICADSCVNVTVDADVPSELILEKLEISGCANVSCTPEQEGAVSMVSAGVANINSRKKEEDGSIGSMFRDIFGTAKELLDTKMVNTGEYVL